MSYIISSEQSAQYEKDGYFIARGGRYVQLEGQERARNVVAKFPSLEAAEECYNSPDYQQALNHARDASERELMIVETTE